MNETDKSMSAPLQNTLYEQLGGAKAVRAIIDAFYENIKTDEVIGHFFDTVDTEKIKPKLEIFMTYAFGGSSVYNGPSLREAHKDLVTQRHLSDEHFDQYMKILKETQIEMGIDPKLIKEVTGIIGCTRDEILNR